MEYTKPPLTFHEQADLLISRGMRGERDQIANRLSTVNYYRLTSYWVPFRQLDNNFGDGTHWAKIWERYVFDQKLRLLVMDAIGSVEVAVRTLLSYVHAHEHGPFAYANEPSALPKLSKNNRELLLQSIDQELTRSKEVFVGHFKMKYGDRHDRPPIWMVTEVMSFGRVISLFQASGNTVKKGIASSFAVPPPVLRTWLWSLNEVRNVCAHHGRLWNRVLGNKPMIPHRKHHPRWHEPVRISNERIFVVLSILLHSLQTLGIRDDWPRRLSTLLSAYPKVPLRSMGFPDRWHEIPLWHTQALSS